MLNKRNLTFFNLKNENDDITVEAESIPEDVIRSEVAEVISSTWEWNTFSKRLRHYIKSKRLKSKDIYERGYVDRKLLHKILTKKNYHPSIKQHLRYVLLLSLASQKVLNS